MHDELVRKACDRASELFRLGNFGSAEVLYRQALKVDADCADARNMLPLAVAQGGRTSEAIPLASEAVRHDPSNVQLLNNLALLFGMNGEHSESVATFEKAIDVYPAGFLYSNLALEYKRVKDFLKCEAVFLTALREVPDCEHVWFNYGAYLDERMRREEAPRYYRRAISLNPDLAVAHYNLATCQLLSGDLVRGFEEYEWRWKAHPQFARTKERLGYKPYLTKQSVRGKTVLLYCEQGTGDLVQFVRYAKLLKDRGARVIVECNSDCLTLMKTVSWVDEVAFKVIPPFDYHCSVMSLPRYFKTDLKTVPWPGVYLSATGTPAVSWEKYRKYIKVGIAWAGNPRHPNDAQRSLYLRDFRPLTYLPQVRLFSLQKDVRVRNWPGVGDVDLTAGAEKVPVVDLSEHLHDFSALASFVKLMDLVVTADTCVAHVAGALGKKVWVLIPEPCDWRWMYSGEKTPWYPTMRLYRKSGPDWSSAFTDVLGNLVSELE